MHQWPKALWFPCKIQIILAPLTSLPKKTVWSQIWNLLWPVARSEAQHSWLVQNYGPPWFHRCTYMGPTNPGVTAGQAEEKDWTQKQDLLHPFVLSCSVLLPLMCSSWRQGGKTNLRFTIPVWNLEICVMTRSWWCLPSGRRTDW